MWSTGETGLPVPLSYSPLTPASSRSSRTQETAWLKLALCLLPAAVVTGGLREAIGYKGGEKSRNTSQNLLLVLSLLVVGSLADGNRLIRMQLFAAPDLFGGCLTHLRLIVHPI